jgi:hypothetical protein
MGISQVMRELRVSFEDNGFVRAVKGELWQITTDEVGKIVDQKHIGTKNSFAEEELAVALPHPALLAQITDLQEHCATLAAERNRLQARETARSTAIDELLPNVPDALKAAIAQLKGAPTFSPNALIALFSEADTAAIVATISGSAELRALYHALSNRAAMGDRPIPIDSPTFLAGLAGLKTALGEERVAELFAQLSIDLSTSRYFDAANA